ncbi:uncharacterized protein LOC127707520 [Mytilus californianus]|uniref:uncharacterized protein LOC127707520 n=1 Tax=Mytilus californianus TaxID=6549 RepID=UPI002246B41D|nr:uncharacterized protein LOC127707520 [Mytilus californianus]
MGDEGKGLDYMYTGCFNRDISRLGLRRYYEKPQWYMSPFACIKYCRKREPSQFVGITSGNVCSCGYNRYIFDTNGPFKVNDTECDINCFGHEIEKCGGNSTFSIYDIVANTPRPSVLPPSHITFPHRITRDTENEGIIAGVSVGLTLLVILAIVIVLIIKRSRSNAKRSLQSCSNTSASVRYDNIQQSLPGVYNPYATLTVANDCQTYDDLMPTEITYENTTKMATHYNESTQDKKHKKRRKKRTKR